MYIVATISRNSFSEEKIKDIICNGATVLRYNFAHGTPDEMYDKVIRAKNVIKDMNLEDVVTIMADMPGNKIRLGGFPQHDHEVQAGEVVLFRSGSFSDDPSEFVPVDFPHISHLITKGQIITLGDGEIGFEVIDIPDQDNFKARALIKRYVPALKGLNPGRAIDDLDHITDKTIAHVKALSQLKPELVAFSFVNSGAFLERAKNLLKENLVRGWNPKVVSKVETPLGVENIADIAAGSDIVLVARGDLGLTIPIEQLGIAQKKITVATKRAKTELIVSTQILDSLMTYYIPARSDVLDLTNIILDGADGIMLAKETGISMTPGYSVATAQKIISYVENNKLTL
jgi:pyruvate kinase